MAAIATGAQEEVQEKSQEEVQEKSRRSRKRRQGRRKKEKHEQQQGVHKGGTLPSMRTTLVNAVWWHRAVGRFSLQVLP